MLVTSRNRLTGLAAAEGAHLIPHGVLTDAESHDLLASHLGAGRAMAEPVAVSDLIALCGGLPLALCVIAHRGCSACWEFTQDRILPARRRPASRVWRESRHP